MKHLSFKTLVAAIALLGAVSLSAQKKNVLVHQLTGNNVNKADIERIHARVVEGLSKLPTINVLDASNDGAEADLYFKCHIDSICVYPKKGSDGKTTYTTEFNMSADVFDAKTDQPTYSTAITVYNSMLLTSFTDKKLSAQSALDWVPEKIERGVWKAFAIKGQLLSIEETKKDKASVVSVALGTQHGAAAKQGFDVYLPDPKIVDKKGNLKENKPIGKIKVQDLGDEISVCKVNGGGDKIYAAYQENPEQLTVLSKGPSHGLINDGKWYGQVSAEYAFIIGQTVNAVMETVGAGVELGKEVGSIF